MIRLLLAIMILAIAAIAVPKPQADAQASTVQLTVFKVTNRNASPAFSFQVTGPGGFSQAFTLTTFTGRTLTGLAPGTYTITETNGAGWGLSAISCATGGTVSDQGTADRDIAVTLAAGLKANCTFTNTAPSFGSAAAPPLPTATPRPAATPVPSWGTPPTYQICVGTTLQTRYVQTGYIVAFQVNSPACLSGVVSAAPAAGTVSQASSISAIRPPSTGSAGIRE